MTERAGCSVGFTPPSELPFGLGSNRASKQAGGLQITTPKQKTLAKCELAAPARLDETTQHRGQFRQLHRFRYVIVHAGRERVSALFFARVGR